MLRANGYKRQEVFIDNVVKCRPPKKRVSETEESTACKDYLERQIELITPNVIVTLGLHSIYRFFPGSSISKIHGQPSRIGNRLVVPMFHPAAALHQPRWRPQIEADFAKLPQFIAQAASFRAETDIDPSSAAQLSLF